MSDIELTQNSPEFPGGLPGGVEIPDSAAIPDIREPTSAVDAIRYLYLAKELHRLGETSAADRWQSKALAWITRLSNAEPS